jgi:hypothetical protein
MLSLGGLLLLCCDLRGSVRCRRASFNLLLPADMRLTLLIGFAHTAIPVDYRTTAMIEQDRARNEAAMRASCAPVARQS